MVKPSWREGSRKDNIGLLGKKGGERGRQRELGLARGSRAKNGSWREGKRNAAGACLLSKVFRWRYRVCGARTPASPLFQKPDPAAPQHFPRWKSKQGKKSGKVIYVLFHPNSPK